MKEYIELEQWRERLALYRQEGGAVLSLDGSRIVHPSCYADLTAASRRRIDAITEYVLVLLLLKESILDEVSLKGLMAQRAVAAIRMTGALVCEKRAKCKARTLVRWFIN